MAIDLEEAKYLEDMERVILQDLDAMKDDDDFVEKLRNWLVVEEAALDGARWYRKIRNVADTMRNELAQETTTAVSFWGRVSWKKKVKEALLEKDTDDVHTT